jgi:hypothetical protein
VSVRSPRGVCYLQHFGRRDGVRIGGGRQAELVNPDGLTPGTTAQRRQVLHIDALYREWSRNRADIDRLRRLYDAIGQSLEETAAEPVQ